MRLNLLEMLPEMAFKVVANKMTLEGKDSPSPPATPDYTGAANATAAGNLEAARANSAANKVNQVTPYGNLTYSINGKDSYGNDLYTAKQSLSPAEQNKLDQNNQLSSSLLSTANTGLGQVNNLLSGNNTALDESKLAQMGISGQSVQDSIMSRLSPELDRQQAGLDNQLANQGIMRGSEAYDTAQTKQSQNRNDLEIQAALQGINTANSARQQGISEQYGAQSRPLDIVNALRTGNQVQNPSFVNVPQQANTAGADLLGAAQGNYNAKMGQYNAAQSSNNNLTSGLFSLAGAGLGAYGSYAGSQAAAAAMMASDRRLKTNIKRIGTHNLGIGLYEWDYIWGEHSQGVMADEVLKVMPMAVHYSNDGYKMVDYGMINNA